MPDASQTDRKPLSPLPKLRGYLAVAFVGCVLLVGDLLQRTFVAAAARLFPRARNRILAPWLQAIRTAVLDYGVCAIGGADFGEAPRLPARPGVLVIMNHQSLLDILFIVKAVNGRYPPRIVTRRRYQRGIPLISHIIRLYQYPTVDPQATVKGHLDQLVEAARNGDTPIVIFPEGTRSRDGSLGRWKRTGLRVLLGERRWEVYVVAVDGLWHGRRFVDFVENVGKVRGRMVAEGPFESPTPGGDVEGFIDEMRTRMEELLASLRSSDG